MQDIVGHVDGQDVGVGVDQDEPERSHQQIGRGQDQDDDACLGSVAMAPIR